MTTYELDRPWSLGYTIALSLFLVCLILLTGTLCARAEDERCGQLRAAHAAGMASQFSKAQVAAARAWYGRNCNGKQQERRASR